MEERDAGRLSSRASSGAGQMELIWHSHGEPRLSSTHTDSGTVGLMLSLAASLLRASEEGRRAERKEGGTALRGHQEKKAG